MHSAGPYGAYGPAGLLSPWTVRPLDVRNPLGDALSSARSALTRTFFDAGTVHQVDCARPEALAGPNRGHGAWRRPPSGYMAEMNKVYLLYS